MDQSNMDMDRPHYSDSNVNKGFSRGFNLNSIFKDELFLVVMVALGFILIQRQRVLRQDEMPYGGGLVQAIKEDNKNKKTTEKQEKEYNTSDKEESYNKASNQNSILNNILNLKIGNREVEMFNAVKPYLPIKQQAVLDIAIKVSEIMGSMKNQEIEAMYDEPIPKLSKQLSGILGVVKPYMGIVEQAYVEVGVKVLEVMDILQEKIGGDSVQIADSKPKDITSDELLHVFKQSKPYFTGNGVKTIDMASNVLEINKLMSNLDKVESQGVSEKFNLFELPKLMDIAKAVKPYLSDKQKEYVDRGLQMWMLVNAAQIENNISSTKDAKSIKDIKPSKETKNDKEIKNHNEIKPVKDPSENLNEVEAPKLINPAAQDEIPLPIAAEPAASSPIQPNQGQQMDDLINTMKTMLRPEERQRLEQLQQMFRPTQNL